MEDGPVRWARSGDASIAWRTIGDGPFDVLFLTGLISHLEVLLEEPGIRRWFARLGRMGRVILMDRRGTGLSDPLPEGFTPEDEVEDVAAVLDAAGSDRAVLQTYAAGGPLGIAFAARHPERTLALVLYASIVSSLADDDIHWALTPEERRERFAAMAEGWGTGTNLDLLAPSHADDERLRAWLARMERLSTTPSGVARVGEHMERFAVKDLLAHIRVPTLVLHREGDSAIDVRHSRWIADRVPGARLVLLPGTDSLPMVGEMEPLLGEVEEFLTGGRGGREVERQLLTVLFTDVADATGHAARLGDGAWRDLLSDHDKAVRAQLRVFGGHEVKTIGDAFLATFDRGPSMGLQCARAVVEAVRPLGLEVRAGVHTGECEVLGDDVGGMAVHIAARVAALAQPGEVLASGTAYGTVVGSGLRFTDRGTHELKGVPGRWPVFALA